MSNGTANDRRDGGRHEARIKIRFASAEALEKEYTTNISRGGLFVNSRKPHSLRSKVKFLLILPVSEETVELTGEIVHVIPAQPGMDNSKAGIGVQFVDLTPQKRELIEKYIASINAPQEYDAPDIALDKEETPEEVESTQILLDAIRKVARDMQELTPEQLTEIKRKIKFFYAKHANKNHYDLLGVRYNAKPDAIRNAYHKLSMDFHPDRHHKRLPPDLGPQVEDIFGRINRAYKTLRDTNLRIEYDVSVGNWASVPDIPELSEEAKHLYQRQKAYQKQFPDKVARAEEMLLEAQLAISTGDTQGAGAKLKIAFSFDPFNKRINELLNELGIIIKHHPDTGA